MKTVNLELSKQLKEKGYIQGGNHLYWTPGIDQYFLAERYSPDYFASPTADELGELLPQYYMTDKQDGKWFVVKLWRTVRVKGEKEDAQIGNKHIVTMETYDFNTDNEADTRAALWLYLKENHLLTETKQEKSEQGT